MFSIDPVYLIYALAPNRRLFAKAPICCCIPTATYGKRINRRLSPAGQHSRERLVSCAASGLDASGQFRCRSRTSTG
jgi:hypothetical protein